MNIIKKTFKTLQWTVILAATVFATIILVRAFDARRLGELELWHKVVLEKEFTASDYSDELTFKEYQLIEEELFAELDEKIHKKISKTGKNLFDRYQQGSLSDPKRFKQNYNRSYELIPQRVKGGVLLVHGLTDSPYSLKNIGDIFYKNGFYVLSLRLPAHGTVPAALTDIKWKDWMAAVKMGSRHVNNKIGKDKPFCLAGYSNGGALSLLYTLQSLVDDSLYKPDRVLLFSPAIGVTKFAVLSNWLQALSFIPFFEKSAWKNITPEYDPFKYASFPLNASEQTYKMSMATKTAIKKCFDNGTILQLPPIVTFQSVVDSTVVIGDLVNGLYARLSEYDHELILFDINRISYLNKFLKTGHDRLLDDLRRSDRLGYRLTIITNRGTADKVVAKTKEKKEKDFTTKTNLEEIWPEQLYSLSHIAIPFPVDDPLYGLTPKPIEKMAPPLGKLRLRGEKRLLRISADDLMRIRCNPFFDFVEKRIDRLCQSIDVEM